MFRTHCLALILAASVLASAQAPSKAPADPIPSIESLIRSQHFDEALLTARSAIKQHPTDSRLYTLEGIAFSLQGHSADAIVAFERALKIAPESPAALRGEAQLLYAAHDKRAILLLERILKAAPNDQTAHEMLGMLDKEQGACSDAIEQFQAATEIIDHHPEALEAYASCLFAESKFDADIPVLRQLSSLLPDRTYPKYDLAIVLVRSKQYDAALKVLEPLLPSDPDRATDPDLLSLASEVYEHAGDTPKAVALLRQAIVLNPSNPSYFTTFADLCLTHESYDAGIAMLNAGIAHMPNEASLYLGRGLLYAKTAELEKAKADFKHAEQLDSGQSLSAYATDLADLEANRQDVALANIRAQLKIYPDSPLLHYIFAKILDAEGGGDDSSGVSSEVLNSALEAARLKPDMVDAHNLLGSLYTRSGQYERAVAECRLALKYAPNDQGAMYHLLIALRHEGAAQHKEEIASLASQLANVQRSGMKEETERKRFRIVEQQAPVSRNNEQK